MDGSNFASALPIVMAASDEHYFRKHAVGFAKSALAAGHNVHLVVSPAPGPGLPKRARQIEKDVVTPFLARFAASEIARLVVEVVENPRATAEMTDNEAVVFINRCVSSIFRHFFGTTADRLLSSTLTVWSCNQFLRRDAEVGLYLRLGYQKGKTDFEREGMQVLGAMVYADPKGASFFDEVGEYLDRNQRRYYVDQHALYRTYLANEDVRILTSPKQAGSTGPSNPARRSGLRKARRSAEI